MASNEVILEMKHIDMRFGGVHALNDVSFTLRKGEVHALLGENGAGKSTLMKILIGRYAPLSGEIIYKGKQVKFYSTIDTCKAGISMIFQEFNHVKNMTVMENIYLGREPKTQFGNIDYKEMYNASKQLLNKFNVDLNPKEVMGNLTIAKCQLVEIVKALSYNSEIIIMDEPTSALSRTEIKYLLDMVEKLKEQGKSIVFITHKMQEVYHVCQSYTVLRDGRLIHSGYVNEVSEKELIKMMVDREVNDLFPKMVSKIGDVVFEVRNFTQKGKFENISFSLRRGEILGISGLMGAGRTELVEAIMGVKRPDRGEIFLYGKKVTHKIPEDAIKNKIVLVSEDRKRKGVILKLIVKDNILLSSISKCLRNGFIRQRLEEDCCRRYSKQLEIKMKNENVLCSTLSGGNQQKVAIAKVLNADPDIIILDEPTRGIDVKTKSEIHRMISQFACEGKSIIMVSSELPEILGMSDRIMVLHEGVMTGILDREEATSENIMKLAIGKSMEDV